MTPWIELLCGKYPTEGKRERRDKGMVTKNVKGLFEKCKFMNRTPVKDLLVLRFYQGITGHTRKFGRVLRKTILALSDTNEGTKTIKLFYKVRVRHV